MKIKLLLNGSHVDTHTNTHTQNRAHARTKTHIWMYKLTKTNNVIATQLSVPLLVSPSISLSVVVFSISISGCVHPPIGRMVYPSIGLSHLDLGL